MPLNRIQAFNTYINPKTKLRFSEIVYENTSLTTPDPFFMRLPLSGLLFLFLLVVFSGCFTPKRALRRDDSHAVDSLIIFPTYSSVSLIEKGDKLVKDEAFSEEAEDKIKAGLLKYIPNPVTKRFMEVGPMLEKNIYEAGIKLIKSVRKSGFPIRAKIPDFLLHIIDSLGHDYGLLIIQDGFTRTPANYRNQTIKRTALTATSLGLYNTTPNFSYAVMIGILIDKKRRDVSLYKELYWRNKDPNDENVIRAQIREILLYYFGAG